MWPSPGVRLCFSRKILTSRIQSAYLTTSSRCQSLTDQFRQAQEVRAKEARTRPIFRTIIAEPAKHSLQQEGMFYTIPKDESDRYLQKGFSTEFIRTIKTFNECSLMVRKPAIEVIHYLKQMNYNQPAVRYVLYGPKGSGRTLTLAHVLHHCALDNWLLVHCPWPRYWCNRYNMEISMSSSRPGRVDQPLEAIDWLKWFRQQNGHLLSEHSLKTTKTYVWSKREQTEEGASWLAVIEYGITRAKYAADCIGVLLREIKLQSKDQKFKTLVMADGVNAFWSETKMKDEDRKEVPVEKLTMMHNFKKMFKNDWTNAAIVTSVDQHASPLRAESYLPRYLLGKEGFELFDPFVPIEVPAYNEKEIYSCLEYYGDRMWIQTPKGKTDEGKKELIFLSEYNPLALSELTAAW
ncbi:small ribosomal subunit protein mS29-like [Lineus longissimus]|uniref:small ribosomal subunit protein mS29-like n=1 Tax=Lineus longissimus TaxID=88925 RepID=UPI00315CC685